MRENTLLKIALICSLVGLVALYFISTRIRIEDYNPNFNMNIDIGKDVELKGIITKITEKDNVAFVELNQLFPITVVVFRDDQDKENLKLKTNQSIEVIGKIQSYKGKNEVIAQKLRLVR